MLTPARAIPARVIPARVIPVKAGIQPISDRPSGKRSRNRLRVLPASVLLAFFGGAIALTSMPARAIDLLQTWRDAQTHDLTFAAARAAQQAGDARRDQGAAMWRPTVGVTATTGKMTNDSTMTGAQFSGPGIGTVTGANFSTSINDGTATNWKVQARQPLFDRQRLAQSRQLNLSANVADLQWRNAQQSLMLRAADRYFDLVIAAETLRVLQEQQVAVRQDVAEMRARFRVGDAPVTDIDEANAREQAIEAQILAAQAELELKQVALADMTGIAPQDLLPLVPGEAVPPRPRATLDQWTAHADQENPKLRMQDLSVETAQQEVERYRITASPSIDLVAEAARDRLSGSGSFGPATNTLTERMIGVRLTVPVFTGGYRSAKEEEALHRVDQFQAEDEQARQQVALQTREAWLGLTVGASRVSALAATLKAARIRLDATKLGHKVGDRSTLDLLDAQSDVAAAELSLLRARVDLLKNDLQLAALAGSLDEQTLRLVNATLRASRAAPIAAASVSRPDPEATDPSAAAITRIGSELVIRPQATAGYPSAN